MTTPEPERMEALKREWSTGVAVLVIGVIVALAVAAWLTFGRAPAATDAASINPNVDDLTRGALPQRQAQPQAQANADTSQVCRTALADAQSFGVLPAFATLIDSAPHALKQQGHYACLASTPSAKYEVSVVLSCADLKSARCTTLDSVKQDDGTVLYKKS